jgi:hypothetical protein
LRWISQATPQTSAHAAQNMPSARGPGSGERNVAKA